MKGHHFMLIMLISLPFMSCKGQVVKEDTTSSKQTLRPYPQVIDSLGYQKLYDKAKWVLYCIHCDDTCKESNDAVKGITYGEFDLRLYELQQRHDEIEINLAFYYDSIHCQYPLYYGVVYKTGTDSIVKYSYSEESATYGWFTSDDPNYPMREINPLQPEVVEYIKKNKNKIHPWFRREAIKRGVISE